MSRLRDIILSAKNVSLKYRTRSGLFNRFEHTALEDVSFELYRGETLGVLGRNGCGKSTLLRLLAGIINPTAGKVECDKLVSRALLSIGLGFRPDLSGRNNALLSAMLGGMSKRDAVEVLDEVNDFAELGGFFDQPVKTYSAGMRARLGFATAIKTEVDILLIDEVLSVGDAHFGNKAQAYMNDRIAGEQTVVFVSHNTSQVDKVCNRALWIESGKVKALGDTSVVTQEYKAFMRHLDDIKKRTVPRLVPKMNQLQSTYVPKAQGQD